MQYLVEFWLLVLLGVQNCFVMDGPGPFVFFLAGSILKLCQLVLVPVGIRMIAGR